MASGRDQICLASGDKSGLTLISSRGKCIERTQVTSVALLRVTRIGRGQAFNSEYFPNLIQSLILSELKDGICLLMADTMASSSIET